MPVSSLPVRDLADAPLARLFGPAGCPLCRRATAIEERFIDAMLDESVNDVRFRAELDEARGFCGRHAAGVLDRNRRTAGSLSSAILFGAILRVRLAEMNELRRAGRGRSRRLAAAAARPACPVCERARRGVVDAADSLVRLSADQAWEAALSRAEVCLVHLVALMAAAQRPPEAWARVEGAQLERLSALLQRVDAFAHHSSEDRRHLLTDEERASVDEVARALGG